MRISWQTRLKFLWLLSISCILLLALTTTINIAAQAAPLVRTSEATKASKQMPEKIKKTPPSNSQGPGTKKSSASSPHPLCQFLQKSEAERLAFLWEQEIYSANIKVVDLKVPAPVDSEEIVKKTTQLKSEFHFTDAISARCNATQVRLLLVDKAVPYTWNPKEDTLKLNLKDLHTSCKSVWLDHADLEGGYPTALPLANITTTTPLSPGTISLTCLKQNDENAGPQLLYLFPHMIDGTHLQKLQAGLLGDLSRLNKHTEATPSSLFDWVNSVRSQQKLPQLQPHPDLDKSSKTLLVSKTVKHDRHLLRRLKEHLAKNSSLTFLGEDRVLGASPADRAILLFLSPRHRSLILHKDAKYMSVNHKKTPNNNVLTTITVAH